MWICHNLFTHSPFDTCWDGFHSFAIWTIPSTICTCVLVHSSKVSLCIWLRSKMPGYTNDPFNKVQSYCFQFTFLPAMYTITCLFTSPNSTYASMRHECGGAQGLDGERGLGHRGWHWENPYAHGSQPSQVNFYVHEEGSLVLWPLHPVFVLVKGKSHMFSLYVR